MYIFKYQRPVFSAFFYLTALSCQANDLTSLSTTPHLSINSDSSIITASEPNFFSFQTLLTFCPSISVYAQIPKTVTLISSPASLITLNPGYGIPQNVTYTSTCSASSPQSSCTITFTGTLNGVGSNNNILYIVGSNDGASTTLSFIINVNL